MNQLTRIPAWRCAIAISSMLFVVPVLHAQMEPTAQQCLDAYLKSEAAESCEGGKNVSSINVFVDSKGRCVLADSCPTDAGETWRTNISIEVQYADELVNCDGVLKLEGCG